MPKDYVQIFDTTLRDGIHGAKVQLPVKDKVALAQQLALLQVDILEAGFPGARPDDAEVLRQIAATVKGPIITGLARTTPEDIEAVASALESAEASRIHLYIPTEKANANNIEEFEETIGQSLLQAGKYFDDIEFSPHNATRIQENILLSLVQAAVDAGAGTVNISDTLGYAVPDQFSNLIKTIRGRVDGIDGTILSVHCHNDLGMAVANSLSAVQAGVRQVECSVNGLGERAGNAALEEIVMALKTRRDAFGVDCGIEISQIQATSDRVSQLSGISIPHNKAIVGKKALDYEKSALRNGFQKNESYEIINAKDVGRSP